MRVRDLVPAEGRSLQRILRRSRNIIEVKRAMVLLHSAQGFSPPKIAQMVGYTAEHVRHLVKEFNVVGLEVVKPKYGGGRPPIFTDEVREKLVALATGRPRDLGLPYQQWSLSKLREEAIRQGIVPTISKQWLSVILHEADMAHLETKTWKESTDPEFEEKKRRIDRLTAKRHNPPVVVAADEMGPISKVPTKGRGWHHSGHPHRVPANYHKTDGTRYLLGAYHVGGDRMWGALVDRRDGNNWWLFLQQVRSLFPRDQRIYVIQDGLFAHWTAYIRLWARAHRVSLVPTPTAASWLNPIECRFTEVEWMALAGSNHQAWDQVEEALHAAIEYRNRRGPQRTRAKRSKPLWTRH